MTCFACEEDILEELDFDSIEVQFVSKFMDVNKYCPSCFDALVNFINDKIDEWEDDIG